MRLNFLIGPYLTICFFFQREKKQRCFIPISIIQVVYFFRWNFCHFYSSLQAGNESRPNQVTGRQRLISRRAARPAERIHQLGVSMLRGWRGKGEQLRRTHGARPDQTPCKPRADSNTQETPRKHGPSTEQTSTKPRGSSEETTTRPRGNHDPTPRKHPSTHPNHTL